MQIGQVADDLLFRTWWSYNPDSSTWIDIALLHGFNLFEGCVWLVLSALVLGRYLRYRRSVLELVYALTFFTFGLTDFREAYTLQSWLIWVKVINLAALWWLRSTILRRFYPSSRLY